MVTFCAMRQVPFYKHQLGTSEVEAVRSVISTLFLTTGPKTKQFEAELAAYLGGGDTSAVGLTSATAALFLGLRALGIGPGDEVITTPMTFIATSNVVLHVGATPVFVEVEPDTGNLDVTRVEAAVTEKTRAIIPVHLYGQMVDMRGLDSLARRHGVSIIEDCAHALESTRDGVRPGELSACAAFSFYATKNLTCGEGGALVTRSRNIDAKVRSLRLHGMSGAAYDRFTGTYRHWDMVDLGYKANMADLQAALLLPQMPLIDEKVARRAAIAARYDALLDGVRGLSRPATRPSTRHAHHLYTVWVPPERRDDVLHRLQQAGIGVAVNYRAVHLLTYYRQRFGFEPGSFPNAERIGASTVSLPMYPTLSDDDIEYVASTLRSILES